MNKSIERSFIMIASCTFFFFFRAENRRIKEAKNDDAAGD